MKFDKSKVYTPFNCEEVKIGSKGYVSDYYDCLEDHVKAGISNSRFGTLVYNDGKFQLENDNVTYQLFYLVEEPKESKKQPSNCAEIEETTRLTFYEVSQLLKCFGVEIVAYGGILVDNTGVYTEDKENKELPDGYKIRYRHSEWEDPTKETVMKWYHNTDGDSWQEIARFVEFIGWNEQ